MIMDKVAVINLSIPVDISQAAEFQQACTVLAQYGIEVVDYASGRTEPQSMAQGVREAIEDPDVTTVLAFSGGNMAISCLDYIDWQKVGNSGKVFAGLSDFTHFSWKAVEAGADCAYGTSLKDFVKYRLTDAERQPVIEFLKTGKVAPFSPLLLHGEGVVKEWSKESIIGGHSFISLLMAAESSLPMADRVLMLEHHYNGAESLDDLQYWGAALARVFAKNPPKAVLLGHSMVMGSDGQLASPDSANEVFCIGLAPLNRSVYYVDHFTTLVPFQA